MTDVLLTHGTIGLYVDIDRAKYINGAEVMRPNAQTSGSALFETFRNRLAVNEPRATPEKPAAQVITPNIRLTLKFNNSQKCCQIAISAKKILK